MQKKTAVSCCCIIAVLCLTSLSARAHMPSIERRDFTDERPFRVRGTIEKGQAVYAWLESGTDVDVYRFTMTQREIDRKGGVHLRVRVNMPACKDAPQFLPWLAIAGPGLPQPPEEIPFTLREGYGAIVVKNVEPGAPQNYFYEQYSKKAYYITDYYEYTITTPGDWYLYYWDPYHRGGDYIAIWGIKDSIGPGDIFRLLFNLAPVVNDRVMHMDCQWIVPPDNESSAAAASCN